MIAPDYITIPLTHDQVTVVDIEDSDLADIKWAAKKENAGYYAKTTGKVYRNMGRIILSRKVGRELLISELCDHVNGDTLDNRRSNLRIATIQENARNSRKKTQ